MTRKHFHFVRMSGYQRIVVTAWIALLTTAGMVSTAAAQAEPTFTMPSPEITLPKVLIEPQIISVAQACVSAVNITYEQRNTLARVQGTIKSSSCPASHGEYTLLVAIRDKNNERSTLEFTETWQRMDDEPLSFVKEYPIGDNVDLARVSLRSLRCSCDDLPAE